MGSLSQAKLNELYSITDLGVVPSEFELLGYVTIEMMAHQIPLIISDVPGMNEIIEDGREGLICKVKKRTDSLLGLEIDEHDLEEKIKTLLKDKALANKIAKNGNLRWKKDFTASKMANSTLELYKQVYSNNKNTIETII